MDISDVIKSRRAVLGLSQAELAKAAGVSVRQLARYEAGEQQPVLSAAVDLADALGISIAQLDVDRALPVEFGSYRWRDELRLWDNEALMGWYRSTDAAVRSKGTMYLTLHPHGTHA